MIKVNVDFQNPNLPKYYPYSRQIAELDGIAGWYQAQSDFATLAGDKVEVFLDRLGVGPAFSQGTEGKQAELSPDELPNGDSAALFHREAVTAYTGAEEFDFSGDAAIAIVWRPDVDNLGQAPVSKFQTSTNRWMIFVPGGAPGKAQALLGATSISNLPINVGGWNLTVIEKTASQHRARSNGVQSGWTSHSNDYGGTGLLTFGSIHASNANALEGAISDVFVFSGVTILDTSAFDVIKGYVSRRYGLGIAAL